MSTARGFLLLPAAILIAGTFAQAQDQKPLRRLVFNFGVSIETTRTQHDSGLNGGPVSGMVDSRASNSDTGTILADVLAVQPDSGLVVRISEQGRGQRNGAPTMCVTYGTGSVICDTSNGGPNEEEMSLLRVLGKNFIDDSQIDAKHHWQTSAQGAGGSETNDYTIDNHNGDVYGISYRRVLDVQGAQAFSASTIGHLLYNRKMTVPISMTEDTVTRRNIGNGDYDTVDQKMTFSLASDSLAAASPVH